MILLDTHIWIWWVHGDARLKPQQSATIKEQEADGLGISVICCWEVAKLVEYGRLELPSPIEQWMATALAYPGIRLLPLTPTIALESTRLPGSFHRDPADQLIVATARIHDCALVTSDEKIAKYPHVKLI